MWQLRNPNPSRWSRCALSFSANWLSAHFLFPDIGSIGHSQARRAHDWVLVIIKLPMPYFIPPKLKGRGHSQPNRVSQSGKKSSLSLSEAVTEPNTFWVVVCSHTISSPSQPEFLVQISLCLFFLVCFTVAIVCFASLSPCCFSQSFQGFWQMVSQNLWITKAGKEPQDYKVHALRSSKSSPLPGCLLLEFRSIARSHSTKFFTWQRCFLLHWDQPNFSDPEHNTHLEGVCLSRYQILNQGCLALKENQPCYVSTCPVSSVPLYHQSRFPSQASLVSLILCLPWKSIAIFHCISQEPQMKATTNLYEQHSGFLPNPLFYSQPFGGQAHRNATRCTPLANSWQQELSPHNSPRAEGKSKNISNSFHYSSNCSNAKLLHFIRDGNPPPNTGQGTSAHFSCELKKQLTWRSKRQSLNRRQIVILLLS